MSQRHTTRPIFSRRSFLAAAAVAATPAIAVGRAADVTVTAAAAAAIPAAAGHELRADVLVIGGSFGGIAAALAAARMGKRVLVTEETKWIGGQATTQGVPVDEHPWIEKYGRTDTYADFRNGVRDYYRRHYPLTPEARADRYLNPGAGWVSGLCFEPRVGMAVLYEMLAPHLSAGRIQILTRHAPVEVSMDGDHVRAITVVDFDANVRRTLTAPYVLDATELGELLDLGNVERVVGAESQAQTGEPNALPGEPDPRDQMGYTHVIAFDYLPGENHVIEKPRDYEHWAGKARPEGGSAGDGSGKAKIEVTDLFGKKREHLNSAIEGKRYVASSWKFRRGLCATNFAPGTFASDVTVAIWGQNEYREGVLCGVSAEERKRNIEAARQLSLSVLYWLQTQAVDPITGEVGYPGLRPRGDYFGTTDGLAQYPYIRESTRIKAEFTVVEQHFRNDTPETKTGPILYKDSVGLGGYRIDIHKAAKKGAGGMTEANHGKHWCQQIPLGALIPVRVENLLPACKNLGVTAVTNGAFRLHPVEWNIGEAAGALAAWCLDKKLKPREIRNNPEHLADFQRELVRQGFELEWPRMETGRSYYSHHNLELRDTKTFYFGEASLLK